MVLSGFGEFYAKRFSAPHGTVPGRSRGVLSSRSRETAGVRSVASPSGAEIESEALQSFLLRTAPGSRGDRPRNVKNFADSEEIGGESGRLEKRPLKPSEYGQNLDKSLDVCRLQHRFLCWVKIPVGP